MTPQAAELITIMSDYHRARHRLERAFESLPEDTRKTFKAEHDEIQFNTNVIGHTVADIVLAVL